MHGKQSISEYYQPPPSRKTANFEFGLSQLISVGLPATKALACLEAVEATPADVYLFWHAIVRATEDALNDPRNEYDDNIKQQVIGILNARTNQLLGDGNLATGAYLAATYLNKSNIPPFHLICLLDCSDTPR